MDCPGSDYLRDQKCWRPTKGDLSVPHETSPLPKARNGCPAESTPAGLPRPFIADHRGHLVIAIYALVLTTLVVAIARVSGSITTACVFAALVTAAASILVLPAVMVLLCACLLYTSDAADERVRV